VIKLTLANILTLSRLFMAPIFLVFALSESATGMTAAVIIFAVAALTDWLDGLLARAYDDVTEQGAFLDPLADKVLTITAFVVLYMVDVMPLCILIVIVIRYFVTTVMRSLADQKGMRMKTSWNAKLKTFLQMIIIVYGLTLMWLSLNATTTEFREGAQRLLYGDVTWVILLGITLLTVLTLIEYVVHNRQLFRSSGG